MIKLKKLFNLNAAIVAGLCAYELVRHFKNAPNTAFENEFNKIGNEISTFAGENKLAITLGLAASYATYYVLKKFKSNVKHNEKDEELVAYHEAGHALLARYTDIGQHVEKITIRGDEDKNAGGYVSLGAKAYRGLHDQKIIDQKKHLAFLFGGRAAEKIRYGAEEYGAGAVSDIEIATKIARQMVEEWGMSKVIGPVKIAKKSKWSFSGNVVSNETMREIELEIKNFVEEGQVIADKILNEHVEELHELAKILKDRKTLNKKEIMELWGIKPEPTLKEKLAQKIGPVVEEMILPSPNS